MNYPRLMTAMITPFLSSREIDWKAVGEIARYLVQYGSGGIVVAGTTGESPTLSDEEKIKLFAAVKDAVGSDAQVWGGVGSNDTNHSVELAKEAQKIGVDGVMAVAPYYNKPSQKGLILHFTAIAQAVDLPVMVYNIPGRTGVNILPETMKGLAQIENIVALKEASGIMDQMSQLRSLLPDDFIIYSGDDSLTLPMMSLGAYGVVSVASHLAGSRIKAMIDAYISGNPEQAQKIHYELFPLFKMLFITTNPIPLKEAMRILGRDSGVLRGPLCRASEHELAEIEAVLKKYNF